MLLRDELTEAGARACWLLFDYEAVLLRVLNRFHG
jgi:hypothetical protein